MKLTFAQALVVAREVLRPNKLRPTRYRRRHGFTRRTPLQNHAWEVVARYREQHPWAGVLADIIENTGEHARVITVTAG